MLSVVQCLTQIFPTMDLKSGRVRGLRDKSQTDKFLGIPFAQPPVESLRWQPPKQPVKVRTLLQGVSRVPYSLSLQAWNGVKDTLRYSKSCYQKHDAFVAFSKMSEDCLYLNVFKPKGGSGKKFAAMVFFYGGEYQYGSAMFPLYNGDPPVAFSQDTVTIVSNYRLDVFGFLGGDRLRASDNTTGNFGIQDQRAALKWVHENAEALEIDTSKVMIYGESAGAGSVSNHLVQEASWPYYTRAIMESGPVAADWVAQPLTSANHKLGFIAELLGCGSSDDLRKCLMQFNTTTIFEASRKLPKTQFPIDWGPVVDGVTLKRHPRVLTEEGLFNRVPILMGTNQDEGTQFTHIPLHANQTDFDAWVRSEFGALNASLTERVIAQYPCAKYNKTKFGSACFSASAQAVGDYAMTCAARRAARWITTAQNPVPVYVYFFTREMAVIPLIEDYEKKPFGVFHGSELVLVFDFKDLLLGKGERKLSEQVMAYWTNFAKTGNPGTGGTAGVAWPAYNASTDTVLDIDIPVSTISGLKTEQCNFWDTVPYINVRL